MYFLYAMSAPQMVITRKLPTSSSPKGYLNMSPCWICASSYAHGHDAGRRRPAPEMQIPVYESSSALGRDLCPALELGLRRLFQRKRSGLDLASAYVCADDHAGGRRFGVDQLQPDWQRPVAEQLLAAAEHDRKHQQPILIDEVIGQQSLDQIAAALNQQHRPILLLQACDVRRSI